MAIWHLLKKAYCKHTMTNVAVWLSCCVYILAVLSYLTTLSQCLTIFFFENYVPLKRSPLAQAQKKTSNHWESRNVKNANG